MYGLPWYTGVRALYYRTDVFTELGLKPPTTIAELTDTAKKIRAAKPDLYGIATGGKNVYGMLPVMWANGGEIATLNGTKWTGALTTPQAEAGVSTYARLISPDTPPCAADSRSTARRSLRSPS